MRRNVYNLKREKDKGTKIKTYSSEREHLQKGTLETCVKLLTFLTIRISKHDNLTDMTMHYGEVEKWGYEVPKLPKNGNL